MVEIRDLVDQGMSDSKISDVVGMDSHSVKRMRVYITELSKAELTSTEIAEKRAELYLEVSEAAAEARALFNTFKEWIPCGMCEGTGKIKSIHKKTKEEILNPCKTCKGTGGFIRTGEAKKFFDAWMEAIDRRMKLYGLDAVKGGDIVLNQQINNNRYMPPDKVDSGTAEKLSNILKNRHELKVREKYEENREF